MSPSPPVMPVRLCAPRNSLIFRVRSIGSFGIARTLLFEARRPSGQQIMRASNDNTARVWQMALHSVIEGSARSPSNRCKSSTLLDEIVVENGLSYAR